MAVAGEDDETDGEEVQLAPDAALWRRIPNWADYVVRDRQTNAMRPSSMAFKDDSDGSTSVYLAKEAGSWDDIMAGHEGFGLVSITAGLVSESGLKVVRQPEPGFPYHAVLAGPKPDRVASKLARASVWLVQVQAILPRGGPPLGQ